MIRYLLKLITGGIFDENFIRRYTKLAVLFAALTIVSISNGYICKKKLRKIENLKIELESLKHENMMLETEVTTHSRHTEIEKKLKERGINLSPAKTVFEIKK
jgi:cell division protein FtsL